MIYWIIGILIALCIVMFFILRKAAKDADESAKRYLEEMNARIKENQEQLNKLR